MYLTSDPKKLWVIDIETDDLKATVVWCLCAANIGTGETVTLTDGEAISAFLRAQKEQGCKFIGHNIIGFDAPTLARLLGAPLTISDIIDTFVMSMLYSPSLEGGHSLDDWGRRLRYPKTDFKDFGRLSEAMLRYCMNDVQLCLRVYLELQRRMMRTGFSELGIEIEHRSWHLVKKQQISGFAFNLPGAHTLYATLRAEENKLKDQIYEYWPPELQKVSAYKKAHKKDGSPTKDFERHLQEYEKVELRPDGGYDCYAFVAFNIGSPAQRVQKLLELGWQPREFTKRTPKGGGGNPKVTDKGELVPSLVEFIEESGNEEVKLIARWIEINARANMINTWIEAYNENTGCIHGSLWLANTLRYRHSNPNSANIPAVQLKKLDDGTEIPLRGAEGGWTYEARDLWTVRDSVNRLLVGVDAKGIQLRVLAHYLNNPKFTEAVVEGDPHEYNREVGGFRTRSVAKTFIYAFLLGAGDEKIGQIIGGTKEDGRDIKRRFISNFPGLKQLLDRLEQEIERTSRIRLCDGTPLLVEAPHTRLGYLLQGDESRLMKMAAILTDREVRRRKLDVIKVGDIHDEWQNDVLRAHVEELRHDVFPSCFRSSGNAFQYRVPIGCDSKVGLTWAETH